MPTYDAFLSYARKDEAHADGTPADYTDPNDSFVKRLYDALTAAGLKIWWDRAEMPARALSFTQEIRDAIHESERLLLIAGPGAFNSEYVLQEIEYAQSFCKGINPILRKGDYTDFPADLRNGDVPDFREDKHFDRALEQLVRQLNEAVAPMGALYGVPRLPMGYIHRAVPMHELESKIRQAVNPQPDNAAMPSTFVISAPPERTQPVDDQIAAVQGMGGIGKTVLAAALAHDCDIRRQFPDGLVWITLGTNPQLTALQENLGVLFGDERDKYTQNVDDNKRRLGQMLAGKRLLIVLDDVWKKAHAEAFLIPSPRCSFLLTTRQSTLTRQLGLATKAEVKLTVLTVEETIALIEKRLDAKAPEQHTAFRRIHELLEGHTLAVSLAAGRIAEQGAAYAPTYVAALERRLASDNPFLGLDELDEDDKSISVAVTIAESYDALSEADQRRFRMTGIFAPDGTFDAKAAAAVWDAPPADTQSSLQHLVDATLLGDAGNGRYDQHSLLRAHARARMSVEEKRQTFDLYADFVIAFSKQFDELPPEQWGGLEPDLPHVHEVGDGLVKRTATEAYEGTWQRGLDFANNVGNYLFRRQQVRRLEWLEMGLSAASQLATEHPDEIDTYRRRESLFMNHLGTAWSALGEKQKALDFYERVLPFYHAVGDRNGEATTLNNIGSVWNALGEKRKALDFHEQALSIHKVVGDRGGEAISLNNIGHAWSDLGEKRKALDFYVQSLPLRRSVEDRGGEANTLDQIGSAWSELGEKRKALDFYEQSLPLRRAVGDRGGEATTLNNIGLAWSALGEQHKALEFFQQALPLFRDVGDRGGEATTLNNIGTARFALGEQRVALDFYEQALLLQRAIKDRGGEALTLNNMGEVCRQLGESQQALACYEQSLPLWRVVENPQGEAMTLNNVAVVWLALGNQHKALEYLEQALPLQRAVGNRGGEAMTLTNIGMAWAGLGENGKALDFYEQALSLQRAVEDRGSEVMTLNNIAGIYFQKGELERVADSIRQIIVIAAAMGAVAQESLFRYNLAYTLKTMGNTLEAFAQVGQAIELLRSRGLSQNAGGMTVEQMESFVAELRGEPAPPDPVAEATRQMMALYQQGGGASVRQALGEAGAAPEVIEAVIAQVEAALKG